MPDTFGQFTLRRGSDGTTFPTTIAQVNPPGPYTADDPTDPSTSPTGKWYYTVGEMTANNVVVPYNTVSIGNPGKMLWARGLTFQGGQFADDYGFAVATDSAGAVYVGGESVGNSTAALAKYSADGVLTWIKANEPEGASNGVPGIARAVAIDKDGNLVVAGVYGGKADFGNGKTLGMGSQYGDGNSIFVAKFQSSDGLCLWAKSFNSGYNPFGSTGNDFRSKSDETGRSITVDSDNNILVTGSFMGTIDFGDATRTATFGTDIFIVKLNSSGDTVWSKTLGVTGGGGPGEGDHRNSGYGVAVDASKNVFVCGTFQTTADLGNSVTMTAHSLAYDLFLAKINSSGTAQWAVNFGASSQFSSASGVTVSGGDPVITGSIPALNFGCGPVSGAVIAKFPTAGGACVWSHSMTNPTAICIASDSLGNIIEGGDFSGTVNFGANTIQSYGRFDAYVTKYDLAGTASWSRGFGSSDQIETTMALAADPSGNIIAVGTFGTGLSITTMTMPDGSTLTSTGGRDVFVVKFTP